jgi:hypothetical protein
LTMDGAALAAPRPVGWTSRAARTTGRGSSRRPVTPIDYRAAVDRASRRREHETGNEEEKPVTPSRRRSSGAESEVPYEVKSARSVHRQTAGASQSERPAAGYAALARAPAGCFRSVRLSLGGAGPLERVEDPRRQMRLLHRPGRLAAAAARDARPNAARRPTGHQGAPLTSGSRPRGHCTPNSWIRTSSSSGSMRLSAATQCRRR